MNKKHRVSRRTFLRGAIAGGTVALALPTLEAMLPQGRAFAEGTTSKPFFGVFYWANGLPWHAGHGGEQAGSGGQDVWTPSTQGANYTPSPLLEPLARHKVNVATGLTPHTEVPPQPPGQGDGHMRGFMVALTGDRPRSEGFQHSAHALTALRPSLDQYIARHPQFYGAQEKPRFRSLEVGVSEARFHEYGHWNAISYNGPDSLNLPLLQPSQLYDRLFGAGHTDTLDKQRRAKLLDAVLEDARDLKRRLGHDDQLRVDAHLEHLRSMQDRLNADTMSCVQPARPSDSGDLLQKTEVMAQLLATAVACDLTRVFSFMLTSPASTHVFNNLGVPDGMHKTCHDGHWERVRDIQRYQMQAFAKFLDAFDMISPTGARLIERGCIFATSEYGEGWKHSVNELPAILVGGANGRLKQGVHTREQGGNFSKVHLTALTALGLQESSFGFSGAQTAETVSGFLR